MDIEAATKQDGFSGLSHRIAASPDYETFIFRKFDTLSARNLLHLEGRLAYLEWKLDRADEQASRSQDNDMETLRSTRVWEAFEESSKDETRPEHVRMAIAEEIRETIKEYQEALLRQNQIASLGGPKKRASRVAHRQFYRYKRDCHGQESQIPILAGLAGTRLNECNNQDLVAIRRPAEKDPLSQFLQDHWVFTTTKIPDDTEHIKESHVSRVAALISIIVAAILLLGAIVSLRLIQQEDTQLGAIAMFTMSFAGSVGVLTNARRAEIFASTAAYAAVLVVFISSPSSAGSGNNSSP